jgi:hypothetical protein
MLELLHLLIAARRQLIQPCGGGPGLAEVDPGGLAVALPDKMHLAFLVVVRQPVQRLAHRA